MKRFILVLLLALMCAAPACTEEPKKMPDSKVTVYVGDRSRKYHFSHCRTLLGKQYAITLAQAKKQGLKPCKVCSAFKIGLE